MNTLLIPQTGLLACWARLALQADKLSQFTFLWLHRRKKRFIGCADSGWNTKVDRFEV